MIGSLLSYNGGQAHRWRHQKQHFASLSEKTNRSRVSVGLYRRSQNVVKHWWHTRLRLIGPFVLTTCWRHFWSIMNKRTAIWNLSVKFIYLFIYLFFILAWYWLKPATLLLSLWHCWIKWNIPTSSYWGASGCHDRHLSQKPFVKNQKIVSQAHFFTRVRSRKTCWFWDSAVHSSVRLKGKRYYSVSRPRWY